MTWFPKTANVADLGAFTPSLFPDDAVAVEPQGVQRFANLDIPLECRCGLCQAAAAGHL